MSRPIKTRSLFPFHCIPSDYSGVQAQSKQNLIYTVHINAHKKWRPQLMESDRKLNKITICWFYPLAKVNITSAF